MITGVPDHVDGRMLAITAAAGGTIINPDRMWHYVEGIKNWNPIWTAHAIRILPGPSSLWLDARGRRLPAPLYPGFDTLGTLKHIMETGYDYSWFLLTQRIIEKEFALSGSEQNPDFTGKSWRKVVGRARGGVPGPVKAFMDKGEDFIVERELTTLVKRMNTLAGGEPLLNVETIRREIFSQRIDADRAQAIIDALVEAGWLREVTMKGPQHRPARRWQVNPLLGAGRSGRLRGPWRKQREQRERTETKVPAVPA